MHVLTSITASINFCFKDIMFNDASIASTVMNESNNIDIISNGIVVEYFDRTVASCQLAQWPRDSIQASPHETV